MNFLKIDGRLYRGLDTLTDFFLLNLVWLIVCIPLITVFPATAALFAVVRGWIRGTESGFFSPFFRYLRENFVQSFVIGLLWSVIGVVLVVDFLFIRGITSWIRVPLFVLFLLAALVYLITAVYLFPVMVHFRSNWLQVIKNSFLIALSSPGETIICLFIVAFTALITFYVPITILVSGSVMAYFIYFFCHRAFQRVEAKLTGEN